MELQLHNLSAHVDLDIFTHQSYAVSVCAIAVTHLGENFNTQEIVDFYLVFNLSDDGKGNSGGSINLGKLDTTGTDFPLCPVCPKPWLGSQ